MSVNCGIVGLPNVGKSTIFKALTAAPAEAENYPFCTIEPNVGIVNVFDERLDKIASIVKPKKTVPAIVEFVDIAGLVKGASKGEGLGNQFLGHIRQVDAIAHVVRCFEDDDIETINIELALADLEVVERRLENLPKQMKSQIKEISENAKNQKYILDKLKVHLGQGKPARDLNLSEEEKKLVSEFSLITQKKMIYICNIKEEEINGKNEHVKTIIEFVAKTDPVIEICGKLESEIAVLDSLDDKKEFMTMAGIEQSSLKTLTNITYHTLGLRTFFTAGVQEVRAWTFKEGALAPKGAGVIHTDFEKGFIKAEVYHCEDLFSLCSESKVKENGKLRIEGKEYKLKDGDIIHFRFNV